MAIGAAIGGVVSLAGTFASMSANTKAAKAEQRAHEARSSAKNAQADELMKRNEFNITELRSEAHTFMQTQTANYAGSGVAVGSGVTLLALEDTQDRMFDQIEADTIETEYKAEQLRKGGDIDRKMGYDARESARSQNTARFLSGVGGAATSFYKGS